MLVLGLGKLDTRFPVSHPFYFPPFDILTELTQGYTIRSGAADPSRNGLEVDTHPVWGIVLNLINNGPIVVVVVGTPYLPV